MDRSSNEKPSSQRSGGATVWIGALKILQSLILLGIGLGATRLIGSSAGEKLNEWLMSLPIDPNGPLIQRAFDALRHTNPHQLKTLSIGSFVYSFLLLIEGTGLCLQKKWGEYFTIFVTGSFIPFELYECFHKFTVFKLIVLVVNAAVLVYLIVRVRKTGDEQKPG